MKCIPGPSSVINFLLTNAAWVLVMRIKQPTGDMGQGALGMTTFPPARLPTKQRVIPSHAFLNPPTAKLRWQRRGKTHFLENPPRSSRYSPGREWRRAWSRHTLLGRRGCSTQAGMTKSSLVNQVLARPTSSSPAALVKLNWPRSQELLAGEMEREPSGHGFLQTPHKAPAIPL